MASYYRTLTIDHTKVPSTQTGFPMPVVKTHNDLRTRANGGHVFNASGYDIRVFSDAALTTAVNFELESYDASAGTVVLHVYVASLSSSVDTVLYLSYGDSTLSTDASSTAVWDSNFLLAAHYKDGSSLSLADSTSNANTGTGANTPTAAVGKIGGGLGLASASTQSVDHGTNINPAAITVSAWVKGTTFPNSYNGIVARDGVTADFYTQIFVKSSGKLAVYLLATGGVSYDGTGTNTLSTGTFYQVGYTYSSAAGLIGYFNGGSDATAAANGALNTTARNTWVGNDKATPTRPFNGIIDEVRISNIARSADWMTTEYNFQSVFTNVTLGSEISTGLIDFDAASNSTYKTASASYSWSHVCTGDSRVLYVGISMLSVGGSSVTGITYNSVAMTFKGAIASVSGAVRTEIWELVAPASGSNSIAVTLSGALDSIGNACSFSQVHQTIPSEALNTASATNVGAADATVDVTTVADMDWVVDNVATNDTAITVGAGQTSRNNVTGTLGSGAMSTEGPKTPAGSVTMNWTSVGAAQTWSTVAIGVRNLNASGGGIIDDPKHDSPDFIEGPIEAIAA